MSRTNNSNICNLSPLSVIAKSGQWNVMDKKVNNKLQL